MVEDIYTPIKMNQKEVNFARFLPSVLFFPEKTVFWMRRLSEESLLQKKAFFEVDCVPLDDNRCYLVFSLICFCLVVSC